MNEQNVIQETGAIVLVEIWSGIIMLMLFVSIGKIIKYFRKKK